MLYLFTDQHVELPQVIPVYNAEPDQVTSAGDFQLFTDPSLVIFNAFPLDNEAFGYFGGGEAIGHEGYHFPFSVGELK